MQISRWQVRSWDRHIVVHSSLISSSYRTVSVSLSATSSSVIMSESMHHQKSRQPLQGSYARRKGTRREDTELWQNGVYEGQRQFQPTYAYARQKTRSKQIRATTTPYIPRKVMKSYILIIDPPPPPSSTYQSWPPASPAARQLDRRKGSKVVDGAGAGPWPWEIGGWGQGRRSIRSRLRGWRCLLGLGNRVGCGVVGVV